MTYTPQFCADVVAKGMGLGASDMICHLVKSKVTRAEAFDQKPQGTSIAHDTTLVVTAFDGQKMAKMTTNDLTAQGVEAVVQQAVTTAKTAVDDPYVGLADPALYRQNKAAFSLGDIPAAEKLVEMSSRMEQAVRAVKGITTTGSIGVVHRHMHRMVATSNGFMGEYEKSYSNLFAGGIAQKGDQKVDYGDSYPAMFIADLPDAESFGQQVAKETVARLNYGKLGRSGAMPVVLSPEVAGNIILDNLANSLDALEMNENKTWIKADHLGQALAGKNITITDAYNLPKGIGSRLFDGYGIAGDEQLSLLNKGVLENFMVSLRGARKSGLTANGRDGSSNLWLANGQTSVEDLVSDIDEGLYVTNTMGRGYRMLTGDLSYSVSGYRIHKGKITDTFVIAAAIAGNLKDLLLNATPANDLVMKYATNAPTLRVEGLTVSGA